MAFATSIGGATSLIIGAGVSDPAAAMLGEPTRPAGDAARSSART